MWFCTGPEYLKKRVLQEVVEGSETTDPVIHEPLLAEEEPLPTPPESPLLNELDSLMPGSSLGRTPSPSPGIIGKEDPKLLSPGSWNEDKTSRGSGSKCSSKPNSRCNSRPATPSGSVPAAAPESGSIRIPSRTPSRQSNKMEQGSDLEIKPLQKFESETKAPDVIPAAVTVRNSLIQPDEDEMFCLQSSKPVTPEHKTSTIKTERASSVHDRVPSLSEGEVNRPSSRTETKSKRQPSPSPSPKPAPKREPKSTEAKPVVTKPAVKVDAKPDIRVKAVVVSASNDVPAESLDLEVRQQIFFSFFNP